MADRWARVSMLVVAAAIVVAACGGSSGPGVTDPPDDGNGGGQETLAPAGERAFVTYDQARNRIIRIDPDGGEVAELVTLEGGTAFATTAGDGAYWLGLDDGSVVKVHADDMTVTPIATDVADAVSAMAFGEGAVWVLHGPPGLPTTVTRIDPATGAVLGSDPTGDGNSFYGITTGLGSGWAFGSSPLLATTLFQLDPATGAITDREVQMLIDSFAVGEGAVWLGGSIFPDGRTGVPGFGRFDPASGDLEIAELDGEPSSMVVGGGAVWAIAGTSPDGMVAYRIDPASREVVATIPLGTGDTGRIRADFGAGFVWVNTATEGFVIDPTTNEVAGQGDSSGTQGIFFP